MEEKGREYELKEGDIYTLTVVMDEMFKQEPSEKSDGSQDPRHYEKYEMSYDSHRFKQFYIGNKVFLEKSLSDGKLTLKPSQWKKRKASKKQVELFNRLEKMHKLKDR